MIIIRLATTDDLDLVKYIADRPDNKKVLGFINRAALTEAIAKDSLYVAEDKDYGVIAGFMNVWRRQDGWVTVMELCIDSGYRKQGIGRELIDTLKPKSIRLKCPEGEPANGFYERLGFTFKRTTIGRNRNLNLWMKDSW